MSWNKPSGKTSNNSRQRQSAFRFQIKLFAGFTILALGIVVWIFLRTPEGNPERESSESGRSRIKEVKPSLSTSLSKNAGIEDGPKERPPQQVGEVRDGFILLSTGKLYPAKSVVTSRCESVSLESRAFTCNSDRLIGSLIQVVPGDSMLGDSQSVYEDFDKDFEESLKKPIAINADDPDDIKEMKQAVIGLRKEIQERKLAGEKPSQIMIESRNQLMELGTYRDELSAQVDKLMEDSDFSEKDLDDLVKAANQMLEDRGAKPLDLPPSALLYSIRHMAKENEGETEE